VGAGVAHFGARGKGRVWRYRMPWECGGEGLARRDGDDDGEDGEDVGGNCGGTVGKDVDRLGWMFFEVMVERGKSEMRIDRIVPALS